MIKIAWGGSNSLQNWDKYTGFCRGMEASVRFNELPSGTFGRRSEVRLIGGDSYGK